MNQPTYILGINSAYHESAACLLKNGTIVAAAEEERFNRIKHAKPARVDNPNELPWNAINFCLKEAGIGLNDVEHIGFSIDPKERLEKNVRHIHPYEPTQKDFGTDAGEQMFYEKNMEIEKLLRNAGFNGQLHFLSHHDCHAASAYLVSPFQRAVVLVIDGIGEFESTSMYLGNGNKMEKLLRIDYPNSMGFLWEKLSKFIGFSGYDAAKVMGLSTYGNTARFEKEFEKIVKRGVEFEIDDAICKFRSEDFSALEDLFCVKKREEPITTIAPETKDYVDIAATLQKVTEDIINDLALKARETSDNLCMAGGVALNCLANGKLIKRNIFKRIFIQPAANDAGTALGAAFYIWNVVLGKPREIVFESPYLGPEFNDKEIKQELDANGLTYTKHEDIERVAAKLIAEGNIVAWFQGRMEIGPRALGNRSILADPRKRESISELNSKVKFRESFRPLCPSVLEGEAPNWFTSDTGASPGKYMLVAYDVKAEKRHLIPAVVHVDGTSRIQTVSTSINPRYHALITEFFKLTGVPIVLNTSFNVREPIVCTPKDAVRTFLKTQVQYLAIGNYLVSKKENMVSCIVPDIPLKEYFERLR